jgi:hypothetical protein
VLEAAGASQRAASREVPDTGESRERDGGRRRRRDRDRNAAPPSNVPTSNVPLAPVEVEAVQTGVPPVTIIPDAAGSAVSAIESTTMASPDELTAQASVPVATHDAITQPAPSATPIVSTCAHRSARASVIAAVEAAAIGSGTATPPHPARTKSDSMAPKLDEVDEGWDPATPIRRRRTVLLGDGRFRRCDTSTRSTSRARSPVTSSA